MAGLIDIFLIACIILLAFVVHEYAHGWVANRCGDATAKLAGRLTLNPLSHIDLFGTVLLPGMLIYMRTKGYDVFVIGWGKPVPVNFLNLRNPKRDMMWVGLAGPVTNVIQVFLFAGLLQVKQLAAYHELFALAIFVNLLFTVFNMIPIPPLDGSRVVLGLLPLRWARPYARLEPYGIIIVIVLLFFGLFDWFLWPFINYLSNLFGVKIL